MNFQLNFVLFSRRSDVECSPNMTKSRSNESLKTATTKYLPTVEEIHVSSIISRRGYLNFLDENGTGWVKRFVVC